MSRISRGGDSLVRLFVENVQPAPRRMAWHGGPTPVGSLRGVTAERAVWRPAPGRKNIWELALHIAYWKYYVRRRLERAEDAARFPRSPANWPAVPQDADEAHWREDVALLKAEHNRLVAVVAQIPLAHYDRPTYGRKPWTVGELIVGIAQHDAYHTGQIQLLKRLERVGSKGSESKRL